MPGLQNIVKTWCYGIMVILVLLWYLIASAPIFKFLNSLAVLRYLFHNSPFITGFCRWWPLQTQSFRFLLNEQGMFASFLKPPERFTEKRLKRF